VHARFSIGYITIINRNIGTVIQHNTEIGGVIYFAIGDMHIAAIIKSDTVCTAGDRKAANGNVTFAVIGDRRRGGVRSSQGFACKRPAHGIG